MNVEKDGAPQEDRIALPSMPLPLLRLSRNVRRGAETISETEGGWQVVMICAAGAMLIVTAFVTMIGAAAWANEQTVALGMASTTLIGTVL